jgi:hypothetical protein
VVEGAGEVTPTLGDPQKNVKNMTADLQVTLRQSASSVFEFA